MSILEKKAFSWGEDASREHADALFGDEESRVIAREYVAIARERSGEDPQVVSSFVAGWRSHRELLRSGLEYVGDYDEEE